jgi:hypothetical protein
MGFEEVGPGGLLRKDDILIVRLFYHHLSLFNRKLTALFRTDGGGFFGSRSLNTDSDPDTGFLWNQNLLKTKYKIIYYF